MIAILYENMEPIRDLVRLVEHITTNAAHFGIDASRLALWSCSGNVPNALAFLPRRDVACAAFCYGYMTAEEEVEDAAKQFGFVLPNLEIEPAQLSSTPIFVVRAGRDETPHLNASLDRFVGEALDQNLPVTVLNLPDSPHGFDIFDASTRSRMAIRQILWFLKANLLTDRGD